ncbi:hypothetical protein TIFTF001_000135 [Ficus carica]|uniref:Plant bHLH transcription factor ACT-like domain-containing protein n=1 Tax=Ficus carica TaxID=3494 RepID=A0AA87Z0X6_FICCA|nr:hypothetical protein TIFTF001_000135 [Ficus carica]
MELKVEKINQDNLASQNSGSTTITTGPNSTLIPVVNVEVEERGFLIKVLIEKSCSGLLVFILEAFEELDLDVVHARVSCSLNFHLEAVVIITDNKRSSDKDAQRVEQAMFRAIQSWGEVNPLE